jgi:hypothetical protein
MFWFLSNELVDREQRARAAAAEREAALAEVNVQLLTAREELDRLRQRAPRETPSQDIEHKEPGTGKKLALNGEEALVRRSTPAAAPRTRTFVKAARNRTIVIPRPKEGYVTRLIAVSIPLYFFLSLTLFSLPFSHSSLSLFLPPLTLSPLHYISSLKLSVAAGSFADDRVDGAAAGPRGLCERHGAALCEHGSRPTAALCQHRRAAAPSPMGLAGSFRVVLFL